MTKKHTNTKRIRGEWSANRIPALILAGSRGRVGVLGRALIQIYGSTVFLNWKKVNSFKKEVTVKKKW